MKHNLGFTVKRIICLIIAVIMALPLSAFAYRPTVGDEEKQNDVTAKISNMISKNADSAEALGQREKDVIVSLVQGMSNKEIADHLCISVNTVITHRRNIARKLQIHSPAGLTIYAIVNNLVDISTVKL